MEWDNKRMMCSITLANNFCFDLSAITLCVEKSYSFGQTNVWEITISTFQFTRYMRFWYRSREKLTQSSVISSTKLSLQHKMNRNKIIRLNSSSHSYHLLLHLSSNLGMSLAAAWFSGLMDWKDYRLKCPAMINSIGIGRRIWVLSREFTQELHEEVLENKPIDSISEQQIWIIKTISFSFEMFFFVMRSTFWRISLPINHSGFTRSTDFKALRGIGGRGRMRRILFFQGANVTEFF